MFATKFARAVPVGRGARMMSGHSAESAQAEARRWRQLTFGMVGLSIVVGIYNYVYYKHEHQERTDLPYLKIRTKPFPWSCPDCELFNLECWKECKAAKAAEKGDHH